MKAIALVVVHGGVAYTYSPPHVLVGVVDRDNIEAGGGRPVLPSGIGFEELCKAAGLDNNHVRFRTEGE